MNGQGRIVKRSVRNRINLVRTLLMGGQTVDVAERTQTVNQHFVGVRPLTPVMHYCAPEPGNRARLAG